jgi:UDP-glucuronate 4-epimerase
MSILVTGSAGFIGSSLVERLLEGGREVVGLDNFDDFYDPEVKWRNVERARAFPRYREFRGDIRDRNLLSGLPKDIEAVVHLAALAGVRPSIEDPIRDQDVNVGGTTTLFDWTRRRGITAFLFASSSSVYGNNSKAPFSEEDDVGTPISPYAASKRAGELLCHTYHHLYGTTVACLRFFTVFGPRQRPDLAIHKFVRLLDAGEPIPMYGDGTTERDYTYIEDTLDGIVGALRWAEEGSAKPRYEIVNLGESRTVSLRHMIEVIAEEMGVDPEIRQLPMQAVDVERTWADTSKASELFGYQPKWEFRAGVREFIRWYREEGVAASQPSRLATVAPPLHQPHTV